MMILNLFDVAGTKNFLETFYINGTGYLTLSS